MTQAKTPNYLACARLSAALECLQEDTFKDMRVVITTRDDTQIVNAIKEGGIVCADEAIAISSGVEHPSLFAVFGSRNADCARESFKAAASVCTIMTLLRLCAKNPALVDGIQQLFLNASTSDDPEVSAFMESLLQP